jgi:predicted ATPase
MVPLQQQAEVAIALCTEQEFGAILAQAIMFRGHALAHQRPATKGIALMREGLDAQFAGGASLFRQLFLSYLAEAYATARQFDEGLTAVAEAFVWMERTGERFQAAELYRQKGDLLLRRASVEVPPDIEAEAEQCYRKSIDIARQQEARLYELKAATSLSRLWSKQGRKAEARKTLADTCGWFTEGFDTADLKDAKALLEELNA